MKKGIETIATASLLPGASRCAEGLRAETWKAHIDTGETTTVAYVKVQPDHETFADLISALVGRAMGLRIPKPYLVDAERCDLPYSAKWQDLFAGADATILFALEDAESISFKRFLSQDHEAAVRALKNWKAMPEAAIFDEWIANTDRNFGNLLFDGDFWLIDHGLAFMGEAGRLWGLDSSAPSPNNDLLNGWLSGNPSMHERYQWRKAAIRWAGGCNDMDLGSLVQPRIMDYARAAANINHHDIHAALGFLRMRAACLVNLLCQKLGIPELHLMGTG